MSIDHFNQSDSGHAFQGQRVKAIVVDVNDPEELGRIKCRIIGLQDKDSVPDSDLPWIHCGYNNQASNKGVGSSPSNYMPGSSVMLDSIGQQDYVVSYSIPNADTDKTKQDTNEETQSATPLELALRGPKSDNKNYKLHQKLLSITGTEEVFKLKNGETVIDWVKSESSKYYTPAIKEAETPSHYNNRKTDRSQTKDTIGVEQFKSQYTNAQKFIKGTIGEKGSLLKGALDMIDNLYNVKNPLSTPLPTTQIGATNITSALSSIISLLKQNKKEIENIDDEDEELLALANTLTDYLLYEEPEDTSFVFPPYANNPVNPPARTFVYTFNTRSGNVVLTANDVINALGYIPGTGNGSGNSSSDANNALYLGGVAANQYFTFTSVDTFFYSTRADAIAAIIPASIDYIRLGGYTTAGDRGGALYKRVGSNPSHEAKFQSADGAYWEIAETTITPYMLGALPNGSTYTTQLQNWLNVIRYWTGSTTMPRLHLPAGTWITGARLVYYQRTYLEGDGIYSSTLKLANGSNDHVLVDYSWESLSMFTSYPVIFKNFCIDGNKANQSAGNYDGLVYMAFMSTIENMLFTNCKRHGVRATTIHRDGTQDNQSLVDTKWMRNRYINNGGAGWYGETGTAGNYVLADHYFLHEIFAGNGTDAIAQLHAERSAGFELIDVRTYSGNAKDDVYLNGAGRLSIVGGNFDLAALGITTAVADCAAIRIIPGGHNYINITGAQIMVATEVVDNGVTKYNGIFINGSSDYINITGCNISVNGTITNGRPIRISGTVAGRYDCVEEGYPNTSELSNLTTRYANNGLSSNSSGYFVKANTGLVVNSTGVFVNAAYINTISSNNASFLGGIAAVNYQANLGLIANSTGTHVKANTGLVANSTGLFVNAAYINAVVNAIGIMNLHFSNTIALTNSAPDANTTSMFITTFLQGTTTSFVVPANYLNVSDTANNIYNYDFGGNFGMEALLVGHDVSSGAGIGSRTALHAILTHNANTGAYNANQVGPFYTGMFSTVQAFVNDGGSNATPKGNWFAFGGLSEIGNTSSPVYAAGVIGAEFDVSVANGSTAAEKMGLQIALINQDYVRGTTVDAGIVLVSDNLGATLGVGHHPGFTKGIALGKPGNRWPIYANGTIFGTYSTVDTMQANRGIDFAGVQFHEYSILMDGFNAQTNGQIVISGNSAGIALYDRTTGSNAAIIYRAGELIKIYDTTTASDKFVISSANGNIGLNGNTAPANPLVITSSKDESVYIRRAANTSWNYIAFYTGTAGTTRRGFIGADTVNNMQVGSDSSLSMFAYGGIAAVAATSDVVLAANSANIAVFYANTLISFTGNTRPSADNTYDLGSTSFRWKNIYTADFHLSNEGTDGNSIDGTTGNWTIEEGNDNLYITNNKTNQKFKIVLEAIT